MRFVWTIFLALLGTCCFAEDWPGWRGPRGDGTSQETQVPTVWDGQAGTNIRWKSAIPGTGFSSPVVIGDVVFLTACDPSSNQRLLHCVDRRNGSIRWTRVVIEAPLEGMHKLNSRASGTPAADEQAVFVTFFRTDDGSGERGVPGEMVVACYDHDGQQQWIKTVGTFASIHGFCTSPVLFRNEVIVNGDHDGQSYLAALNRHTGELLWKTPRVHQTRSYVTPLLREVDGKMQLILSGSQRVAGFDPVDGRRLWWIEGPTEQFVASMVDDGDCFYLTAGFPTYHVMAIRPGGEGDVTESHVKWHVNDAKSYVPSPVVVDGLLFVADDRGIAHCFDTSTGERLWRERLGRHFSASLVAAAGRVYFTSDDGETTVMRASREPEVVAVNELGESVFASPAISEGDLFVRTREHLFCIRTNP
ncbi:PQQ-binding-like beta-propeller repeat protein [Roseiconus nitratireducens]|uniref:PQQ-binding-like beta-propeller repeat protein n=1 Tax=Roseiconus nitratireducens TaxID=2605748 RepID=A0A5M6D964_9BACT|nr:PQQ-binding-like beta-propeller repeat protein [Roseiconus nitratireducens]KAA5543166.1 PQQ-binding-like beta-propeller repeat protein [Roseiconus nitratireducens]